MITIERWVRGDHTSADPVPVQLRFVTGQTGDEYVTRAGWRLATLERCPLHRAGGCGFARHGTYKRRTPAGTHIARWYCPQGHCTFSLLPDHLAARFPGTLAQIERVVAFVETARSLEAAADALRPDPVTLASALRWVTRRTRAVRTILAGAVSLQPQTLLGCAPTIAAVRARLGGACVLQTLRGQLARHLHALRRPLGFAYRGGAGRAPRGARQHDLGPDPPPASP